MTVPEYETLDTLSVMGLPVHYAGGDMSRAIHPNGYIGWLNYRIAQRKGTHVVTLNAEMCMQAQEDPQLHQFISQADLVVPDGSGIELYFRFLTNDPVQRYPGIELAADLLQSLDAATKVAFYGGRPEVVTAAANYWRSHSPQLNLVIVQHGYAQDVELDDFVSRLAAMQPDVVFVGLGVPRQEFWIAEHRHLCPNAVWVGVGGSYDIWSGVKTRAPKWLQNLHLEWLFRLYQEPWRWRRMLALPHFVWASFWYRLRKG